MTDPTASISPDPDYAAFAMDPCDNEKCRAALNGSEEKFD